MVYGFEAADLGLRVYIGFILGFMVYGFEAAGLRGHIRVYIRVYGLEVAGLGLRVYGLELRV